VRQLDKMTNGSKVEVNETGTQLTYQPGVLLGGRWSMSEAIIEGWAIGWSLSWHLLLSVRTLCI